MGYFDEVNGVCSLDDPNKIDAALNQLSTADSLAKQSFNQNKSVDSTNQECSQIVNRDIPCDIRDAVIAEIPGGHAKSFKRSNDTWVEDTPVFGKQRKISIAGHSGAQITDQLHVLSDKPGGISPTQIEVIVAGFAYHSNAEHPLITIVGAGRTQQWKGKEEVKHTVYRKPSSDNAAKAYLLDKFWPLNVDANVYNINIETCGVREEGSVVGSHSFEVHVYPSDQYTLTLKIPPFKKTTHESTGEASVYKDGAWGVVSTSKSTTERVGGHTTGRSEETAKAYDATALATKTTTTTNTDSKGYTSVEQETTGVKNKDTNYYEITHSLQHGDKKLVETISSDEPAKPVKLFREPSTVSRVELELKRNGTVDDTTAEITKIIETLKYYEHTFKEIMNFIKNFAPQVGWKLTLDISFFSGELALGWGYREHTDNTVFFGWSASVDVKLVEASVELSFGFQATEALIAKVTGTISGSITLKRQVERNSPDQSLMPDKESTSAKGEVTGDLNGDASIGIGWLKVERKAGINCGFEVEGALCIDRNRGVYIEGKIGFKPLQFYTLVKDIDKPERLKYFKLTDPKPIWEGSFPEEKTA